MSQNSTPRYDADPTRRHAAPKPHARTVPSTSQRARQASPRGRTAARGRLTRRRLRNARPAIIMFVAMVAVVCGGVWLWLNRSVSVSVNGERTDVRVNSTLADIVSAEGLTPAPGNLVSVGGNVLEEGGGAPFSATVNGQQLDAGQIDDFRAAGNEDIQIGDGADATEATHQEEREVQPQLEPYERIGAVTFVSQWGRPGKQMFTIGDVSGEEAPGDVTEPVQNVVLQSLNPTPDNGEKVVALTFDDGPSDYTQRYLDILSEHNAHATFFCLGTQAQARPELVKAIEDQGSQVASHTLSHKELPKLDADTFHGEVTDAFTAITDAGAPATSVIRPPYGALDANAWVTSGGTFSTSVIWTLDSLDWKLPGVDAIVNSCTQGVYPGAIILMHDGGGNRDQDLEALPRILQTLSDQGYSFVTIDELLAMDSRFPEQIASGNATMPEGSVWATSVAGQ